MANAHNLRVIENEVDNLPKTFSPQKDNRQHAKGRHQDYVKLFSHAIMSKLEVPTMKGVSWSKEEKERIDKDLCVLCGSLPSEETSFICKPCSEKETVEDIRKEINDIRQVILSSEET